MSVVTAVRWIRWRTRRHALDETGLKTLCGYDVPITAGSADVRFVPAPFTWREYRLRREAGDNSINWYRDSPKYYCGLCKRITGYG